jgi:UDP-N-acetylbacillosamine N-acetyltransferase
MSLPSRNAAIPVVIWGASSHAAVVADILRLTGRYEVAGFIDDFGTNRYGQEYFGARIVGGRDQLEALRARGVSHAIVGFGKCSARLAVAELLRSKGFELATAIHPRAVVAADAPIGAGTVIAAGAVVNPNSKVGENVIVNTLASVEHDCVIEDGAHLSPGVRLAGHVHIGRCVWVGIGTTIIERLQIGAGSIIGAGAAVVRNIPEQVMAYGVPAKVIRKLKENEN